MSVKLFFSKTEQKDLGKELSTFPPLFFQDLFFTSVYYESGCSDLDVLLGKRKYFVNGYYSFLSTTDKTFQIVFKTENESKAIGLVISREDIIDFKVIENQDLEVTDVPTTKNTLANTLKAQGGLVGGIVGSLAKKNILNKIKIENCNKFILKYLSKNEEIVEINLYVQKKFYQEAFVFVNTYYKLELSEEAKNPKKNKGCFIATATYKDLFSKEVIYFREYRDLILLKSKVGQFVVEIYYFLSPSLSKLVFRYSILKTPIKYLLDKIYEKRKNGYNR